MKKFCLLITLFFFTNAIFFSKIFSQNFYIGLHNYVRIPWDFDYGYTTITLSPRIALGNIDYYLFGGGYNIYFVHFMGRVKGAYGPSFLINLGIKYIYFHYEYSRLSVYDNLNQIRQKENSNHIGIGFSIPKSGRITARASVLWDLSYKKYFPYTNPTFFIFFYYELF